MSRKMFEMTTAQKDKLLEAMKPVPYMIMGGLPPPSLQAMANAAWERLGAELGFDHMSVLPSDKGQLFFTAIPKAADVVDEPKHSDNDAPICPWCERQGWDNCGHFDDIKTCRHP